MKRSALIAVLLVTFIISCTATPTSTPMPQVAVVTRIVTPTPQAVVVMATPEPTDTPTEAPTPTETATPTKTPLPTTTPKPTEAPTPKFHWISPVNAMVDGKDSWDTPGWSYMHTQGGNIEVVEDDRYGKALRYVITEEGNDFRVQLDKRGPVIKAPFTVKVPIWIPDDFSFASLGGWNLLSVFSEIREDGHDFNLLAVVNLYNARAKITALGVKKPYSGEDFWRRPGTSALQTGWNTIELQVGMGGELRYILNGQIQVTGLSYKAQILKEQGREDELKQLREQVRQLHGGSLYGKRFRKGTWIKRGPIEIIGW